MRRIGTLTDGALARRFCDYLITLSIEASTERDGDEPQSSWNLWIRDEQDVERAKAEFAAFQQAPQDGRYQVEDEAARIRHRRISDHVKRVQQQHDTIRSMPRDYGSLGPRLLVPTRQENIPVTIAIIVIAVIASLTSNFSQPRGSRVPGKDTLEEKTYYGLSFVDRREYDKNEDPFASIRRGQVWRVITPLFLHGSIFHLLFNMLWVFYFGSVIERLHGSLFFLLLVLGSQVAGMALQVLLPTAEFLPESLRGSPFAVGASGAVYGLFGFLWVQPALDRGYPIHLGTSQIMLMLGWLVICMTPLVPRVANGAHLGGLFAGVLVAALMQLLRR